MKHFASGDINNDNYTDIVVAELNNPYVLCFRNTGNGNFVKDTLGLFVEASYIKLCDYDYDNDNDVLVASFTNSEIVLFENSGNDNFVERMISGDITNASSLTIGDIDNDGDCDIACATQHGSGIVLFLNQGNYIFVKKVLSSASVNATCIEIDDVDSDGDMDIICNNNEAMGGILIYKQINIHLFQEEFIIYPWAQCLAVNDMNDDERSDIVVSTCGSHVAVFYNNGSSIFQKITLSADFNCGISLKVNDFNYDSRPDIMVVSGTDDIIGYWENMGDKIFILQIIDTEITAIKTVCYNDLNNDSLNDIICSFGNGILMWLENRNLNGSEITSTDNNDYSIFYNEVSMGLYINSKKDILLRKILIYNVLGQIMIEEKIGSNDYIDCSRLPAGTYIICPESDVPLQNKKFTVV